MMNSQLQVYVVYKYKLSMAEGCLYLNGTSETYELRINQIKLLMFSRDKNSFLLCQIPPCYKKTELHNYITDNVRNQCVFYNETV